MRILDLITNEINQNGYHFNKFTKNKIGVLYAVPNKSIPEDCLACDGYVLKINDYRKLYSIIGTDFNNGEEKEGEFRIPDYNISKRFLQPGDKPGEKVEAGLPNIKGQFGYYCLVGTACDGAFRRSEYGIGNPGGGGNGRHGQVNIDASRSNSIFGKSTTVQPSSQIISICIKYK